MDMPSTFAGQITIMGIPESFIYVADISSRRNIFNIDGPKESLVDYHNALNHHHH
jgi:hypothetical protein